MKKVCILGLGYIGLPTSLLLTTHDFKVHGVDTNKDRVERIRNNNIILKEIGFAARLSQALATDNFSVDTSPAVADYFVIAVPTPCTNQKKADVSFVWAALEAILAYLQPGNTIIIESTIPVGLTEKIAYFIEQRTSYIVGVNIFVAHCPERVLPGNIFHELIFNDRIIGGVTPACAHKAQELYATFVQGALSLTDAKSAEMIKLLENSYRDVNIAFAHQVASMANQINVDPFKLIELANKHPRVNILSPSCGVGGHCIALDPWFLIESFPEHTTLLRAARMVNDERPQTIIQHIQQLSAQHFEMHRAALRIIILGITYKPNIDDIRESPALQIVQALKTIPTIHLRVYDPQVEVSIMKSLHSSYSTSLSQALENSDLVVCLVKHKEFEVVPSLLQPHHQVLDYCGLLAQTSELSAMAFLKSSVVCSDRQVV